MKWGTFTLTHIVTLILAAAMLTGLYFLLRKKAQKVQTGVLGALSFLGIAAILYELLAKGEPLANLPLHLCSINAMLLPFVVFTRNKTFGNLLLVWCLGALAALILNYDMTEASLFSWDVFFYYFPHVVEFGIPILLVLLGHVKKDPKCIVSTIGISMVIYTVVHFFELADQQLLRGCGLGISCQLYVLVAAEQSFGGSVLQHHSTYLLVYVPGASNCVCVSVARVCTGDHPLFQKSQRESSLSCPLFIFCSAWPFPSGSAPLLPEAPVQTSAVHRCADCSAVPASPR